MVILPYYKCQALLDVLFVFENAFAFLRTGVHCVSRLPHCSISFLKLPLACNVEIKHTSSVPAADSCAYLCSIHTDICTIADPPSLQLMQSGSCTIPRAQITENFNFYLSFHCLKFIVCSSHTLYICINFHMTPMRSCIPVIFPEGLNINGFSLLKSSLFVKICF